MREHAEQNNCKYWYFLRSGKTCLWNSISKNNMNNEYWKITSYNQDFFYYLGFLSQTFMNHGVAAEEEDHFSLLYLTPIRFTDNESSSLF